MSKCECSLHLPLLGIMKFFLFLFLHSLVCLVIVLLLEIWVISSFSLIQIAPEWTSWTNYLFLLCYFLGVYSKDWNYWVKGQEKFYSSHSKIQIAFGNTEPIYKSSSMPIPLFCKALPTLFSSYFKTQISFPQSARQASDHLLPHSPL